MTELLLLSFLCLEIYICWINAFKPGNWWQHGLVLSSFCSLVCLALKAFCNKMDNSLVNLAENEGDPGPVLSTVFLCY